LFKLILKFSLICLGPRIDVIPYSFNLVKVNCLITVKDEAMKAWVLEQNNELTNVVVKAA